MIRIPSPIPTISIYRDPREDAWRISFEGEMYRLRMWSWGERRRIVECATSSGRFDSQVFSEALLDCIVEPRPEQPDTRDLVFVCLHLLDVPKDGFPVTFGRAEFLAVKTFGWWPSELDVQPALLVDRLIQQVEMAAQPADKRPDDGWTRIVFEDAEPEKPRHAVGLSVESLFTSIAKAAGHSLEPATQSEEVRPIAPAFVDAPPKGKATRQWENFRATHPGTARLSSPETHIAKADKPREEAQPVLDKNGGLEPMIEDQPMILRGVARLRPVSSQEPRTRSKVGEAEPAKGPAMSRVLGDRLDSLAEPSRSKAAESTAPIFPPVQVHVRWPEPGGAREPDTRAKSWPEPSPSQDAERPSQAPPSVPPDPFAQSAFEEQLADVLDRAAREAGLDLL